MLKQQHVPQDSTPQNDLKSDLFGTLLARIWSRRRQLWLQRLARRTSRGLAGVVTGRGRDGDRFWTGLCHYGTDRGRHPNTTYLTTPHLGVSQMVVLDDTLTGWSPGCHPFGSLLGPLLARIVPRWPPYGPDLVPGWPPRPPSDLGDLRSTP